MLNVNLSRQHKVLKFRLLWVLSIYLLYNLKTTTNLNSKRRVTCANGTKFGLGRPSCHGEYFGNSTLENLHKTFLAHFEQQICKPEVILLKTGVLCTCARGRAKYPSHGTFASENVLSLKDYRVAPFLNAFFKTPYEFFFMLFLSMQYFYECFSSVLLDLITVCQDGLIFNNDSTLYYYLRLSNKRTHLFYQMIISLWNHQWKLLAKNYVNKGITHQFILKTCCLDL